MYKVPMMKFFLTPFVIMGVFMVAPAWAQSPFPLSIFGPFETACNDGLDNDGDALVDCRDNDCRQPFCEWNCLDGMDGDNDGLIDCSDQDCELVSACFHPSLFSPQFISNFENCNNGLDDDRNGLIDCNDPGCNGSSGFLTGNNYWHCPSGVPFVPDGVALQVQPQPSNIPRAATAASGVLAALVTVSALMSLGAAAASAQSGPELLRSLLPFSAVHRRQAPWGRVVEARSNTPIAGAVLSLIDEGGKVRATETARNDGTFGFFVPPGTYRIVAQQEGYQFPAPAPEVALFPGENVYDGGWIPITEESILALVVVGQELSHTALANIKERLQGIWTRVQVWQARLAMPLLLVGGALTLLSFWNGPSLLLGLLLGVYVILFALELLLARVARRAVGVVRDAETSKGIGLAVVRLLDQLGRLSATRVTLASGHFFLMPAPGKYRVDIVHPQYRPYAKERFSVRKFFFGVAGIRAKLLPK